MKSRRWRASGKDDERPARGEVDRAKDDGGGGSSRQSVVGHGWREPEARCRRLPRPGQQELKASQALARRRRGGKKRSLSRATMQPPPASAPATAASDLLLDRRPRLSPSLA